MTSTQTRTAYVIAVVSSVIVLLLRMGLQDVLQEQARLLPFVLAVIASAWWGGLGPGLLATALGVMLGVFFIVPPDLSLRISTWSDAFNAVTFLIVGTTVSLLCEALHASRRRETERRFRTLADTIPQLVWMATPDGRRTWFNRRWEEYTGATSDQLAGNGWQGFHDPAHLGPVLASWSKAIASGTPWEETYPLRGKDGRMRWHLARAVPVRDDAGAIVCWFGTTTDIEDRVYAENALKEADARKDEFLALLAHELRNPLAPLSTALELWPSVANDPAEMENLRLVMSRQTRQLVRLIDDLMDVSRITRGKITLRRRRVDLNIAVKGAVEAAQPLVAAFEHRLSANLCDQPIIVDADAARLTQIFSNLLNNAAKYTDRGGEISVTVERRGDHGAVSVRDNGIGIPARMLTEIFEPFRQADATLTRSQGGLGIGLMLAKRLVEMHDGTIEARSDGPGCGSEFVVTFPALAETTAFGDDDENPAVGLPPLSRRTVLVVDDFLQSARLLAQLLGTMGQEAHALGSGTEALEWAIAHHPDMIILDVGMPEHDGYEVAGWIRQRPELSDVVLVALTGFGQRRDQDRAFEAGFNFHLTKPATKAALERLLRKLPERSCVATPAAATTAAATPAIATPADIPSATGVSTQAARSSPAAQ